LEEKKGEDILLLDIHELTTFADYFVICSGTSDRMLQALADAVMDQVRMDYKEYGIRGRKEGLSENGWVLVDFGDVILHLFSPDRREYYQLEELWNQSKILLRLQ
jgi:ribosome-associated protein